MGGPKKTILGVVTVGTRTVVAKTCPECGELKLGCEFQVNKLGYHHTVCDGCLVSYRSKQHTRNNNKSIDVASNYRKGWTNRDLDELERLLFTEKLTHSQIATRMGRSIRGINSAVVKYISLPPKDPT